MRTRIFCTLLILLSFSKIGAAEELNYNLIQFGVVVEEQVDNDLMQVIFSATSQAESAHLAGQKVNDDMEWALDLVKDKKQVRSQTLGYTTFPQYKGNLVIGWNTYQQLMLESKDVELLSKLAGMLQNRLKIENMQFMASTDTRQRVMDRLVEKALGSFRDKSLLIMKSLGGKEYKIVNASVSENRQTQYMPGANQMRAMVGSAAPAENLEVKAGESLVEARVDGSIQIVY